MLFRDLLLSLSMLREKVKEGPTRSVANPFFPLQLRLDMPKEAI
jgi:hypothetical protein